jgi:phosphoglycolate phosphatase
MASVLFDLDGVLADSRASILAAHRQTLPALGVAVPSDARLEAFIGPPLRLGYAELLGAPADSPEVDRAVVEYRARYRETLRETTTWPGVREALAELEAAGVTLGVCTSKAQPYASLVLDVLGIAFDVVAAPAQDGVEPKTVTLERALAALPDAFALVGDRSHDVVAAHDHGLLAVGALWGFGGRAELEAAGADVLVAAPAELPQVLLNSTGNSSSGSGAPAG